MEIAAFMTSVVTYFWNPAQPWLMASGLLLWAFLHRTLPEGSQYVLKQTLAFFVLCLLGELSAAIMHSLEWNFVASGLHEFSLFGIGVVLIRFVGLLVFRVLTPALHIETPRILEDIAVIAGYGVWLLARMRYTGVELSHIVATSAVITAVVAFAMQDTLGNILGGLAIHLDHSVEIGDWVIVDGVSGRVMDIRWRYTKIATRNGEKVVVPNSQLMKSKFTVVGIYGGVVGQRNAWRRWVWFNVGFEHLPMQVIEVTEHAVRDAQIANVAGDPAPNCVLMEFGPGYARYAMRYWLTDPQADDPTDSAVRVHIFAALERAGIPLAIPEEAHHLIKENAAHEAALAARELQRRIEAIRRVDLFRNLSEEELKTLAHHLTHAPFVKGDVITHQGAHAHWLYILVSGEAEVWLEEEGERRLLSTVPAGNVIGEMGLLTGEPRRATVIARTDIDCYRLDKEGLVEIMKSRPAIAEEMSHILAARDAELESLRQYLDKSALARRQTPPHESILGRIREYFGLDVPSVPDE
jgi:small-conductance mechanosensitive channel/CRP-like cAMP-binding protein